MKRFLSENRVSVIVSFHISETEITALIVPVKCFSGKATEGVIIAARLLWRRRRNDRKNSQWTHDECKLGLGRI